LERRHHDFGERVRAARKAKGWKQKELAAAVSVEPVTVSRWERGEHMPDVGMIQRIADATDQPIVYFISAPSAVEVDRLEELEGRVARLDAATAAGFDEVRAAVREIAERLPPRQREDADGV
jgi:transcriptional regulator with XRE-family HTH domain